MKKKVEIPNHIKSDLCNRLFCHPNELEKRLADMSVDEIMRELIAWHLGYAEWWGKIKEWQNWATEYKAKTKKDEN